MSRCSSGAERYGGVSGVFQVWLSYLHPTGSTLESERCRQLPGAASHDHDGDEEQTTLPGPVQLDRAEPGGGGGEQKVFDALFVIHFSVRMQKKGLFVVCACVDVLFRVSRFVYPIKKTSVIRHINYGFLSIDSNEIVCLAIV